MNVRRTVGLAIAVLAVSIALANQESVGIARDEVVYMQSGARYADWWIRLAKLSPLPITPTFGGPNATDNNREHPPFAKTLFGLSRRLLHDQLGMDEVLAYRAPTALLHGLAVLLVYLMVLQIWGFLEATLAALLLVFLPRALFHASLAAFDAPIMAMWFATVFAYWRCLDGRRWPWQAGVVFGLALATKHTAVLLPFALGLHYVIMRIRTGAPPGDAPPPRFMQRRWRGRFAWRHRVIASLAILGPATLIAVWPWLWLDPFGHIQQWLAFHMSHVHYNFEYLGHNWNAPRFPWHVALVTTLFTVPVTTLVGAATGAVVWIARRTTDARMPALLLALSAAASIGPFLLGTTPIFGAEKHWMPALPTICIAAGVGIAWAARALAAVTRLRVATIAVVGIAVVGAAAVETVVAQPFALTWYNALAGGAPGGADRGMNRQFWGVAALEALPVIAAQAPASGARPVYTHDAAPAWGIYLKHGLVPRSLPDAGWEQGGVDRSQLAIVIHEKHFNRHDYLIWKSYRTVQPVFVLRSRGVPIVSMYRRP